jgi:glutamate-1-semialdehyde 2,1-aminomutase
MVTTPLRSTKDLIDRGRIQELVQREEQRLNANTEVSAQYYERAKKHMVGGVPSSYQARDPWPIYLSHGKGSKVWDVDGTEMVDFHNGFG